MQIDTRLTLNEIKPLLDPFWELSGRKILQINENNLAKKGTPVVTIEGTYQTIDWTDWTQGFQFGSELLQYDATGQTDYLDNALDHIRNEMAPHVSHHGVHDHGFNNLSTFGNFLRLYNEGKVEADGYLREYCVLAIKSSAAVQASRWTNLGDEGYIYSFNGPHSLFVDTIRTVRILEAAALLGHYYSGENDEKISLLDRAIQHALTTAKYAIYYGEGRDLYDIPGRTAHESIFNTNDGNYRGPSTQQGYSGYSTWTRGLSWAMLGFAEQLEFISRLEELLENPLDEQDQIEQTFLKAAEATCDFYIEHTALDGIPYWDTAAPGLLELGNWRTRNADPCNQWEPVDSSAAAIGAQGLFRLANYLEAKDKPKANRYFKAGLTVANTLLHRPYLSTTPHHQGLLLHSIYHRPNNWDHTPEGSKIPHGESSMWGDYHFRELALYLQRLINDDEYYTFFTGIK